MPKKPAKVKETAKQKQSAAPKKEAPLASNIEIDSEDSSSSSEKVQPKATKSKAEFMQTQILPTLEEDEWKIETKNLKKDTTNKEQNKEKSTPKRQPLKAETDLLKRLKSKSKLQNDKMDSDDSSSSSVLNKKALAQKATAKAKKIQTAASAKKGKKKDFDSSDSSSSSSDDDDDKGKIQDGWWEFC